MARDNSFCDELTATVSSLALLAADQATGAIGKRFACIGGENSTYLNGIRRSISPAPWHLGFSYGRALQQSCLKHRAGHDVTAGQEALLARARANGQAAQGLYRAGSEPSDGSPLFEANYSY